LIVAFFAAGGWLLLLLLLLDDCVLFYFAVAVTAGCTVGPHAVNAFVEASCFCKFFDRPVAYWILPVLVATVISIPTS